MYYYSKSTRGFCEAAINVDCIPADAVKITAEEHAALLKGQSDGLIIAADDSGHPVLIAPPPPTAEQIRAQMVSAVQEYLDAGAQTAGYDNIFTACTYADEPSVPRFQAEGQALRAWRSRVWNKCHEVLADIEAGNCFVPSAEELIFMLPTLVLP